MLTCAQIMEPGHATLKNELRALVESGHDGSLTIINGRTLRAFPCAAKLEAFELLSGSSEGCASSSPELCTQLVLEAAVLKAAQAMQDSSAQEAVIMLLSLVKLALRTTGNANETKPVKAPEPLKPRMPETLPEITQTDESPFERVAEQHSRLASEAQHDIIPSACQSSSLPLWLKIRNNLKSLSDTGAAEQRCQRGSESAPSVTLPGPQTARPLFDYRAASPPHPILQDWPRRPTGTATNQCQGSSSMGQQDKWPHNDIQGNTTLSDEKASTSLHSSWKVRSMDSMIESTESDDEVDDKGTLASSDMAGVSTRELLGVVVD
mmetsp:Transcript_132853/g.322866  ORF Transcript_132853/g.322866 Transcript_132853/m.322866 type:complete len:322 (-) Transcript_132853:100-1065(-)